MPSAALTQDDPNNLWCDIHNEPFTVIEHPGVIKNIDNGIASLGGENKIHHFLDSRSLEKSIGLLLRPEDAFRRPIRSQLVDTQNLMLKVTVPKRTGRKRKRGSNEPYQNYDQHLGDPGEAQTYQITRQQLRTLRENADQCELEVLGIVRETHRFRTLPDFQFAMTHNSLASKLRKHVLPFQYEKLHDFSINFTAKASRPEIEMPPPPSFSQSDIPFNYLYQQNPYVKLTTTATGTRTSINNYAAPRQYGQIALTSVPTVPTTIHPQNKPEEQLPPRMRDLIVQLRTLFERRPVMTRRVMLNALSREHEYNLKHAVHYVSYMFRSGPFRDAFIRLGVDPRRDPEMRQYQTIMFKLSVRAEETEMPIAAQTAAAAAAASKTTTSTDTRNRYVRSIKAKPAHSNAASHLFDGSTIHADAKIWQMCDITDPLLRQILDSAVPRSTCHVKHDGWLQAATLAKLRVIMRDKMSLIRQGVTPSDEDYARLVSLPENIDGPNAEKFDLRGVKGVTNKEKDFALDIKHEANMMGQGKEWDGVEEDEENTEFGGEEADARETIGEEM